MLKIIDNSKVDIEVKISVTNYPLSKLQFLALLLNCLKLGIFKHLIDLTFMDLKFKNSQ